MGKTNRQGWPWNFPPFSACYSAEKSTVVLSNCASIRVGYQPNVLITDRRLQSFSVRSSVRLELSGVATPWPTSCRGTFVCGEWPAPCVCRRRPSIRADRRCRSPISAPRSRWGDLMASESPRWDLARPFSRFFFFVFQGWRRGYFQNAPRGRDNNLFQ